MYFCNAMIKITDFLYTLPEDRIAKFPLAERDQSKLLVYSKDGTIHHEQFKNIVELVPANALMVFNNTKVIPARLHFKKESGAEIEIFLLSPEQPSAVLQLSMQSTERCTWQCTIGNLKRWKAGIVLEKELGFTHLNATLINRDTQCVEFSWTNNIPFADVVEAFGATPLPPYLKREAEETDKQRYQTVYSEHKGAVAAPTAGLHFTKSILQALRAKGVEESFVTLHVSAGTFQPVKTENALEHAMHSEQVVISKHLLEQLLRHSGPVIPVGTTSMRTLESMYWMGANLLCGKAAPFNITQHTPYELDLSFSPKDSLVALIKYLEESGEQQLIAHTAIYIHPGYRFKICDALVTNFHQPGSTLMLLVAAFIGEDWKKVYAEALEDTYRFLSYGDSSLLWKK